MSIIVPANDAASILPSAAAVGNWQLYMLGVFYIAAAIFAAVTVFVHRIYYKRLELFTFKTSFLAVSFVFMMFRAITSLAQFTWILFWLMFCSTILPMLLQFTSFSFLILFLARRLMVVQGKVSMIRSRLYPIYFAVLFVIWLGSILLCYFMTRGADGTFQRDSFDVQTSVYASLSFGFAVTLQGIYAYKTYSVLTSIALTEKGRVQVQRYMVIISIYLTVFMVRTVWNLTNYMHINPLQALFYNLLQQGSAYCWTIYVSFYTLLEILPIAGITFLFTWLSRNTFDDSEKKPILRNESRAVLNAPLASSQGIPVDRSAMEINRGTDTQPSSFGSNYSSTDGTESTITSPLRIDAKDLVNSEPSSLSSSLGASWGRLRRSSSSDEEEDAAASRPSARWHHSRGSSFDDSQPAVTLDNSQSDDY
eukprot:TRINITY_DN715_c0_g2_i1.p1 TRINITY_DN715_c0_g2~~TRINITY_DN715_c0_g2_i1.p1  ORF type:complete len:422 (+),score=62.01 TRINITY_DN715_c0_g2_i1:153-1418(+)